MAYINSIKGVWAFLKRGFTGAYHNISVKYLLKYIDEFVFRLNEGSCEIDRMSNLVGNFGGKQLRYKDLIK